MNATEMKAVAVWHLRFEKQMRYVSTEFGPWNADVYAATSKKSVEIEIKVSKSDLRADFKKRKHRAYRQEPDTYKYYGGVTPNYFYYFVTKPLEEDAIKLVEANAPEYGVLVYDPLAEYGNTIKCARRSKRIHSLEPSQALLDQIAGRMSSELAGLYSIKDKLNELCNSVRSKVWTYEPDTQREEILKQIWEEELAEKVSIA